MIAFLKRLVTIFVLSITVFSTQAQKKELTDEQCFKSNFKDIIQPLPVVSYWLDNSHFVLLKNSKKYVVDCSNGNEREATDADTKKRDSISPAAYNKGTDLYIKLNGVEVQLTNDKDKEINPTMSPDGNYVAFTRNNDLYTINISTKKEIRLTTDGSDLILNGYASWLYMEEILGRAGMYRTFWWSPDSKTIAFFRSDDSKVPVFTITNSKGLHGEVENTHFPKVGDPNPAVKVGFTKPEGGNIVWADFNEKDDQYFGLPYWKPDSRSLLVQWVPRDQHSLKIYETDPLTGSKKEFYTEQQKTWVDLDDEGERIFFLKDNQRFILQNDVTGRKHLYLYDINGKLLNPITTGNFTVQKLYSVDEKNGIVYFSATGREGIARWDYYRVNLDGKGLQRLTFGDFNHGVINPSPDGSYFISIYNNAGSMTKMALVNNKATLIKELGDAKGTEFDKYDLAKTEVITVKSDDGLFNLPMKVTWPLYMDKTKKYPVLISIYGGPGRSDCKDNWTLTGNQQWYAKEGLIQVSMDHRGSEHFGKEGANYLYHDLGHWELVDYTTLVKWLITNGSADATKICITGFSYGGYMSTLALTKGSDVFTYGMAGGPVTDWALYDSHYTERYMGLPAENPEGYKSSSVLNFVDRYKGMLQIVHGEIDNNVHMQNSLQLISKLQDAKKDFEMMVYPGGRHGWPALVQKSAHFQNLKTKFIYRYLLQKEVPNGLLK